MAALRKYCFLGLKRNNFYTSALLKPLLSSLSSSKNYRDISTEYTGEKDPGPIFCSDEVQNMLKKLTRVNLDKVYRHKKLQNERLESPQYKFMTEDELQKVFKDAAERANEMLQMPPVIKVRESVHTTLSEDPALQGCDTSKFVFTDITYGVSDRNRLIVIRDTDGKLKKADWDTRHRMNQIYFPLKGRKIKTPLMFSEEYLKNLLDNEEYEFILDAATIQFEPDDPLYQKVCSLTYQHINEHNKFEMLRSTRHFGPLVFYLTWFKTLDNFLLELISTSNIGECNSLLKLYSRLHEKDFGSDIKLIAENDTRLIEKYISEKSSKKGQLELALQSYKELAKQKQDIETDIKKAHGIS